MSRRAFRSTALIAPLAFAVVAALPAPARAQFATYVAHPARAADSAQAATVAVGDTSRRISADSANRIAVANMKAWVDSAAVAAGSRVPTSPESTTVTAATTTVTTSSGTVADAGMRAPDTASPLPTLLVGGAGAMVAGLLLLRRRRA